MVAGFARTKESESPGEKGPQAWVGFIGTVLSCKARRIQRRRVNGQAGIRANLQRTRRLRTRSFPGACRSAAAAQALVSYPSSLAPSRPGAGARAAAALPGPPAAAPAGPQAWPRAAARGRLRARARWPHAAGESPSLRLAP